MNPRQEQSYLRAFWQEGFFVEFRNCAVSFLLLALVGYGIGLSFPEVRETLVEALAAALESKGMVDSAGNLSFLGILSSNILACFNTCFFGLIPFLFLPALALGINAAALGLLAATYQAEGLSLGLYFVALLPHGILELPALVLALAVGMRLCREVTRLCLKKPTDPFTLTASDCGRVFLWCILPLLTAAALVETFVTPNLLQLFS